MCAFVYMCVCVCVCVFVCVCVCVASVCVYVCHHQRVRAYVRVLMCYLRLVEADFLDAIDVFRHGSFPAPCLCFLKFWHGKD